jgi:two-component system, NtrC family, sensor histidine kinase PilS
VVNPAKAREIRDWLLWFLKLRVIVYTVILGILVGVEQIATPGVPFAAVMEVLLGALTLTLIYSLWVKYASNYLVQALVHIVTDLVIITLIVHLTGGTESYFSILYFLPIAFSSLVLYQRGALLTAFFASMVHASLLLLTQAGLVPTNAVSHPSLRTLIAFITLNTFAFLVVGYISGYLSESLRRKGAELVNKTGALASLKALNENIIQSLRGGLLTTDLEGKVTILNPAGEEIVGRSQGEVVGRSIMETFPNFDFEVCIQQLNDGRRNVRLDSILKDQTGEERFLGLSASPLYGDQHVLIGYLVNFQDLTEMKRLEAEIRSKDRMAAVGEMAAGMAHEIRNPLASISGSVGLLRKEVPMTEEQDKLMSIVLHESQRLNKIIDGFLIYSREIPYNPRTVDLNELMDDTVTLLHNSPEVTDQHRIERRSEERPLKCDLDPDLIKQVFWNLSHNAIRAMPDGGTLSIELKRLHDSEVSIVFRDTGIGIEEERIDRIFEPFHSSFANGTGLGLAIVYQIIQAHQGHIEVHSSKGRGSVFELSLPCQIPVQTH